jgi:hypothetical protein
VSLFVDPTVAGAPRRADEMRHADAAAEEWVFTAWTADGTVGLVSGLRVTGSASWYWAALARAGRELLHVTDWSVPPRADPLLVKGHGLWAEHTCDAPMEQWTVANETYAAALDDPTEALGRAYGVPTAMAFDLEWYATAEPVAVADGYVQDGVVHGLVELPGDPLHLSEVPSRRWHRWGSALEPVLLEEAFAHTGLRAPFAFPDGTVADWVLTPDGWRQRPGAARTHRGEG